MFSFFPISELVQNSGVPYSGSRLLPSPLQTYGGKSGWVSSTAWALGTLESILTDLEGFPVSLLEGKSHCAQVVACIVKVT